MTMIYNERLEKLIGAYLMSRRLAEPVIIERQSDKWILYPAKLLKDNTQEREIICTIDAGMLGNLSVEGIIKHAEKLLRQAL